MHDRLIDIDGYLNAQGEFRCHLRTARVKAPHTGPHLATLTEAQARQLVADLQAALAELTCTGAESYEPAPGPCPACERGRCNVEAARALLRL